MEIPVTFAVHVLGIIPAPVVVSTTEVVSSQTSPSTRFVAVAVGTKLSPVYFKSVVALHSKATSFGSIVNVQSFPTSI